MRARARRRLETLLRGVISSPKGASLRAHGVSTWRIPAHEVLIRIAGDARFTGYQRGEAARILRRIGRSEGIELLLEAFNRSDDEVELHEITLALGLTGPSETIHALICTLESENAHRRQMAVRALGIQFPNTNRRSAKALTQMLLDKAEVPAVRHEAAEALAYLGWMGAVPALIEVLKGSDASLRFWAVFALGSLGGVRDDWAVDQRIVAALEEALTDEAPVPGWWPVGKEALGMLGDAIPGQVGHARRLKEEIERVATDEGASDADKRWVELFGDRGAGRPEGTNGEDLQVR